MGGDEQGELEGGIARLGKGAPVPVVVHAVVHQRLGRDVVPLARAE
ncbi:hypothetical protein [Williamsia limnetica]|nr:hypothetical protein [Williamsia limnetica]